jgi:hypothetical protein
MPTVQENIATVSSQFAALSASRRSALVRQACSFIVKNPGCADHSNFWRASKDAKCGLSARQVITANYGK